MTKWTITEPGKARPERPKPQTSKKIAWRPAFEINDKTPKGQATGAASYNEMRQWIIDNGGMESK